MKRIVAFILIHAMLFLFCACGKPAEPTDISAPESSIHDQSINSDPDQSDMLIYSDLNPVVSNADARMMISEDVALFGLTDKTTQEDLLKKFGEPNEIVPNPLEWWGRVTYVYDNMCFTFIETLNDEPFNDLGLYVAEFKRDDLT